MYAYLVEFLQYALHADSAGTFLLRWRDGCADDDCIDDAHIQPYSGHATRTSLEIYSRLAPR